MQAQNIKQEALYAIAQLPDNANMEEILYQLYVLENIRKGQEDAEQGKTTPADQLLQELQSW